jgi:hypothetical protein
MTPPHLGDRRDVHEVDDLEEIGLPKSQSLGVAVDRDHAQAELTRPPDRAPLVPARADEENSPFQTRMMLTVEEQEVRTARLAAVALTGKRILLTGGAGFIGSTLARRLVEDNEVIALDNLHRDAMSGSELAEHPNLTFTEADVLDADAVREAAAGATHIVHLAAIAGVDTVRESPVRTMRVNVIGTYNVLEAALATRGTVERLVEISTSEIFGTHAYNVAEGHVSTIG